MPQRYDFCKYVMALLLDLLGFLRSCQKWNKPFLWYESPVSTATVGGRVALPLGSHSLLKTRYAQPFFSSSRVCFYWFWASSQLGGCFTYSCGLPFKRGLSFFPPIPFRNVMMRVWNPGANSVPVCREGSSAPPAVLCGSESRFEIGSWSARTHLERQENSGSRFLPVCAPPAGMLCSCQTHCGACSSSSPRLSLLSLLCSGVGLWPEVP